MLLKASLHQLAAQAGSKSLIAFARLTHPKYEPNWHHKLLASKLEAVARGEIKRLIISMPPRHGKTDLASLRFAPWFLGQKPNLNIVQATYAAEFAEENGKKSRNILASKIYNDIFPDVKLAKDSKAVSRWQTNHGGSYYAVGVGGPLTGRGANILLIDDPHKNRAEAESPVMRDNVWDWFTSTAYTRLEDNGSIIVIMTRWHEDDLAGRLLKGIEHWEYLSLPAIAEIDEPYRQAGDPLWPEKFDLHALNNIKDAIGSREWISLYQQRPSAAEGEIFKRDWWKYCKRDFDKDVRHDPFLPKFLSIVQSWDTAFKAKTHNDWSVCETWGMAADGYYLLDVWRKRVEFPELKKAAKDLGAKYRPNVIYVEDKASGQSLIQELQRDTRLPILGCNPDSDKIARAYAVTPMIKAGNVYICEGDWNSDFIDEHAIFPNGVHDDQVDSTTQALAEMLLNVKTKSERVQVSHIGR